MRTAKQVKTKGYRNIGITAKPPSGSCSERTCPWHGTLSIRGRQFIGRVVKLKTPGLAIVEWDYPHYIWKYERYERRHSHVAAHNPSCIGTKVGDIVRIAECRPLSKTKAFVVVERL
ncbi:MAG: 30S ribosomal protein S17 [Candidatus Aenigmatarchaeota archaeon]|nr:30S ribosomal protein S17 [Candidatus Aenigmarchaeota archaeon]